jgi:hypothetical protein
MFFFSKCYEQDTEICATKIQCQEFPSFWNKLIRAKSAKFRISSSEVNTVITYCTASPSNVTFCDSLQQQSICILNAMCMKSLVITATVCDVVTRFDS